MGGFAVISVLLLMLSKYPDFGGMSTGIGYNTGGVRNLGARGYFKCISGCSVAANLPTHMPYVGATTKKY